MTEVKGAYVRTASGLVREMSPFQAFIYCFLTLGLYTITQNLMYSLGPFLFPGADIGLGILTGAIVMVFIYAAYSMLASAMPRSGGDYVFQSRVLHPALGFTSTAPMWVIWQFFYLGWYGFMLVSTGVSPFLLITGTLTKQPNLIGLSTWSWSADGQMVIAVILLLISFAIAYKGMKFYIKAQTLMFILEIIGAAVAIGIVISVSRETFIANFNSFMVNYAPNIPDFYHYVIKVAQDGGYELAPKFSWTGTIAIWSLAWATYPYGIWSIQNMGEIKRANSLTYVFLQTFLALIGTAIYFAAWWYVLVNTMGSEFLHAISYVTWSGSSAASYFPISPFYMFLAGVSTTNIPILFIALIVGPLFTLIAIPTTIFMAVTRNMFAMTFDRLFPEKMAYVDPKSRSPTVSLIVALIGGLIFAYLISYRYDIIGPYFASVSLAVVPTLILGCLAAAVMPWRAKAIYERSPSAKYKIGSIPLVTIMGIGGIIVSLVVAWYFFTVPGLGFLVPASEILVVGVFIGCAVYYYLVRWYRAKKGIELDLAFKDVPPE